ncbi:MAG: hypothetical protein IT521_02000 [Burkholderiales bacterium]|nr:hypothetical protein [Burkholderiales bacterium]
MSGRGKSLKSLRLIEAAKRILTEIQPASVRAVCYRLFVEGLIPSMEKTNTNSVSTQLVYAREEGIVPWGWIVDEARRPECVSTWANPQELINAAVNGYRRDYWSDQPEWIEVWSEKGTVRGTLAPILDEYGITFRVMHGHGSATVLHDVAEMASGPDKSLTVLYIGDRDPSGMHMSELDLPGRIDRYLDDVGGDASVDIIRIAIDGCDTAPAAGVPSFPARDKTKDPRHRWYVENYGPLCWELDALSPAILRGRVEREIVARLDVEAWDRSVEVEAAEVESMKTFFSGYPGISGQATKYGRGAP